MVHENPLTMHTGSSSSYSRAWIRAELCTTTGTSSNSFSLVSWYFLTLFDWRKNEQFWGS